MPVDDKERRQMNVRLPQKLVVRVKHAAIDIGESQQDFIERAVNDRLQRIGGAHRRSSARRSA